MDFVILLVVGVIVRRGLVSMWIIMGFLRGWLEMGLLMGWLRMEIGRLGMGGLVMGLTE